MTGDMSRPRLLIVDDHADTLRLFETFLSLAGFDVTAVSSVDAALKVVSNGFEAITTDLAMPGSDGLTLIRRMRAARTRPPIPIVAVTGQPIDSEKMIPEIGCCRLLLKPCDLDSLAETVRFLIAVCPHDCESCPHRIG